MPAEEDSDFLRIRFGQEGNFADLRETPLIVGRNCRLEVSNLQLASAIRVPPEST